MDNFVSAAHVRVSSTLSFLTITTMAAKLIDRRFHNVPGMFQKCLNKGITDIGHEVVKSSANGTLQQES